jgi:hypothetical protein
MIPATTNRMIPPTRARADDERDNDCDRRDYERPNAAVRTSHVAGHGDPPSGVPYENGEPSA